MYIVYGCALLFWLGSKMCWFAGVLLCICVKPEEVEALILYEIQKSLVLLSSESNKNHLNEAA